MRVGTIASLAASAALGLGALAVARVWLPSQSAKAGGAAAVGVPVVIARGPIAYGAKLQATDLLLTRIPADAAPPGAYTTVDQVMKADSGGAPVALSAIAAHEAILPTKLSGPGAKPTLAAMIGQGMRAYTIAVTEVAGGGGHILPGDRVDVLLTRDVSNGAVPGGNKTSLQTDIVMQDLKVLGMDLNVDPASTKPAVAHTATLEVDATNAERLALAAQAGTLSLALRRVGAAGVEQVRPVATTDLGPAVGLPPVLQQQQQHASGHRARHKGAVSAPVGAAVLVVHGEKEASFNVPAERLGAGV
jgi:pilus assembly protein CpaB